MAITGFEMAAATRLIAPVVKDLYSGAKGNLEKSFKKWRVDGYAPKLSKKIGNTDKVKTIWSPDKDISLLSIYYPSKILLEGKRKEVSTIDDFGSNSIVVEGIVGQGKSIFLRYLCLQELTGSGTGRIPLFLELRTILPGKTLKDYLFIALEKLDLAMDEETFDYLMESGKIALMLDGFDELPENIVTQTISEVELLVEKYPGLKLVVTSRPENEIQKSRLFTVVKISKLLKSDFDEFLKKLSLTSVRRDEIINAINNSPRRVSDLINTPLMLTLLVLVYEAEKEIPSELPEFFEKLFHTVFTKHDRLKAGFNRHHHCGLSERKLQELFEGFCFMALQNGYSRSMTSEQFHDSFTQALDYTNECKCKEDDFKKDITKVACLMLEEGFDLITFLHKSICEYYGAGFIKRSSAEVAELFYEEARLNYVHWEEVLYFLRRIDPYRSARHLLIPTNENILKILDSENINRKNEDLVRIVLNIYKDATVTYFLLEQQADDLVEGDEKTYVPSQYGPLLNISSNFGHHYSDFRARVIVDGIQSAVPDRLTVNEIIDIKEFCRDETGRGYEIKFVDIPKLYSVDDLVKKVLVFEERIRQELIKLKKLISQEESKKLIFKKKEISK